MQRNLSCQNDFREQKYLINREHIHLEQMLYVDTSDMFIVKVADTMDAAVNLMEIVFEFHAEIEGHKLFRKWKW